MSKYIFFGLNEGNRLKALSLFTRSPVLVNEECVFVLKFCDPRVKDGLRYITRIFENELFWLVSA